MFPQKYFIMAPLYQWMNSWNSVSDFGNIANHEEVTNQQNLFIKEKKGTYYYDIHGKLIEQIDSDEYKRYIVMDAPNENGNGGKYHITIPNKATIARMKKIGKDMPKCEKGIAVATDGSCSSKDAIGNKEKITSTQWEGSLKELLNKGKTIAYLIHSHPVQIDSTPVIIGSEKPSDIDLEAQFFENQVGAIISWQNVFNKPVQGYSHDKNDYIAYISFYSKNSKIDDSVLMHMSLWDFENKFGNL